MSVCPSDNTFGCMPSHRQCEGGDCLASRHVDNILEVSGYSVYLRSILVTLLTKHVFATCAERFAMDCTVTLYI